MSLIHIFYPTYYFDKNIEPLFPGFWGVVAIMGIILMVTIVLNLRSSGSFKKLPKEKKFWWTHWLNIGYTVSLVELVWLFFRFEAIPYLNWRLWPALMILGVLGWLGYLGYYRYKLLPQHLVEKEQQQSRAYYFRRRKK